MRLLCFFLLWAPMLALAAEVRPAKLGQCVACHGEQGISRAAGVPHLAGQDEAYLKKALTDYRSGARDVAPMSSIANTLQPRDIDGLAHWFATRPGFLKKTP